MQIVHIPKIALFLDFSSLCNFAKKKMKITLGFVQHIYFKVLLKKILKMGEKNYFYSVLHFFFFWLVGAKFSSFSTSQKKFTAFKQEALEKRCCSRASRSVSR